MWQALREELKDHNFELVTVGLDTLGAEGCRPFIEAANPKHPSLIDQHHVLADLYGVNNIPQAIWINEQGQIVRPAEAAPAPPQPAVPKKETPSNFAMPTDVPQRFVDMMGVASKIRSKPEDYHAALRDWVMNGDASPFALSAEAVVERSRPRNADSALGHAHFELATALHNRGLTDEAVSHFRRAHELVPDSWTFRRQAWSLRPVGDGPLSRFWQGPDPADPESWPYAGDWLSDVKATGPENYSDEWQP